MNRKKMMKNNKILILGGTGFIGSRLVEALVKKEYKIRLLVRDIEKTKNRFKDYSGIEILKGDVLKNEGLEEALQGIRTTFYLIHSMGGRTLTKNKEFAIKDKKSAQNFIQAANKANLERVIYLGGLGEVGSGLSEHLKSRTEVAAILSSTKVKATVLRAAVIIGAGGASFEMLRYLVERLPVMICPKWINTRIQPIAVKDVLKILVGCLENFKTAGQTFDICGPDVLTYRQMMYQYADTRGIRRPLVIPVPVLSTQLSAYWVDLVTPIPSGIAHPLIEGLKNEVVCKNNRIYDLIPMMTTNFKESVKTALHEEQKGPGALRDN